MAFSRLAPLLIAHWIPRGQGQVLGEECQNYLKAKGFADAGPHRQRVWRATHFAVRVVHEPEAYTG
ncbi:unnamed protein product [Symbiodinium natans]|uniref:Uncharacterized protein n=1 Tax=Symbiodinium natans TaxID=878477 RepID=A0A812QM75_9DINO|nr:unnamed protein product [Symbiodinium natans]